AQLSGYTGTPTVALTNRNNNSTTNATVNWNATTAVSALIAGTTYSFASPTISYNGYNCLPTFNPSSAVAGMTPPVVSLSYACTSAIVDTIMINVSGLSSSTSSVNVIFTPNNGGSAVSQAV